MKLNPLQIIGIMAGIIFIASLVILTIWYYSPEQRKQRKCIETLWLRKYVSLQKLRQTEYAGLKKSSGLSNARWVRYATGSTIRNSAVNMNSWSIK